MRTRLLFFLALCGVMLSVSTLRVEAQTNFGSVNLGSSRTMLVILAVPSGDTLSSSAVVTGGAANMDFTDAGGGTCIPGVALGATCTVQVSFTPKFAGARSGAVVLADATGIIATAYLQGSGVGPQAAFVTTAPPKALPITLTGLAAGIAVDGGGNVYIGDSGDPNNPLSTTAIARVLKEAPSGGAYTQTVVAAGLYAPQSIGIDGAGNLYIHDAGNGDVNSDAIYKEVLFNGEYVQSVVAIVPYALGQSGPAISSVAVDGAGNVYYLGQGGAGAAADIFAGILQPDGSYVLSGPLPTGTFPGASCSANRTDSVAVDGNGTLYYSGYIDCAGAYQSFTYYDVFVYSSGIGSAPVPVSSFGVQHPLTPYSYLPPAVSMLADSRANLYFWSAYIEEFVPTVNGYTGLGAISIYQAQSSHTELPSMAAETSFSAMLEAASPIHPPPASTGRTM